MGAEAAWVPLVIGALGAGASVYNTQRTERRQDRSLAEAIRNQSQRQQGMDAEVARLVSDRAGSDTGQFRQQAEQQYLDQVRRASSGAAPGLNQQGRVSDAFAERAEAAEAGLQQYGGERAGLMAREDAPGRERFANQRAANDSRIALNTMARDAQGQAFLDDLRTRAIRRNPWIDAAGSMMSGYASGMGGAGAMTGTSSTFGPYADGYRAPPQQQPWWAANAPNYLQGGGP